MFDFLFFVAALLSCFCFVWLAPYSEILANGGLHGDDETRINKYSPLDVLLVVLGVSLSWLVGWYLHGSSLSGAACGLFLSSLVVLSVIDARTMLLPDVITLPTLILGLLASWAGLTPVDLLDSLIGATFSYVVLFSISYIFQKLTNEVGLGGGDVKLFAAIGAWSGMTYQFQVLSLSAVIGIFAFIFLRIVNRKSETDFFYICFGPYLAIAGAASYLGFLPFNATFFV